MKYVTTMDAVWRIPERNFKKLKRKLRDGGAYDLDDYGKMIIDRLHKLNEVEADAVLEEED